MFFVTSSLLRVHTVGVQVIYRLNLVLHNSWVAPLVLRA